MQKNEIEALLTEAALLAQKIHFYILNSAGAKTRQR